MAWPGYDSTLSAIVRGLASHTVKPDASGPRGGSHEAIACSPCVDVLAFSFVSGSASAQEPGRVYKIGLLWIGRPGWIPPPIEKWASEGAMIRDGLRDSGYVVGKNLLIDLRHANGDV